MPSICWSECDRLMRQVDFRQGIYLHAHVKTVGRMLVDGKVRLFAEYEVRWFECFRFTSFFDAPSDVPPLGQKGVMVLRECRRCRDNIWAFTPASAETVAPPNPCKACQADVRREGESDAG